MRGDSPFVLALGGTLAIHLILIVAIDAVTVIYPYQEAPPAPHVELVEVEVPPAPPKPPPPPVVKPAPEPEPAPAPTPKQKQPRVAQRQDEPPPTPEPPPVTDDPAPGGDEVVQMEDIAPAAKGVAVKQGKRNTSGGRGGSGGGTGGGSGAGSADEPPPPVSVATIKKAAMPKGDYGYFNTGTDYPAEAKQLGIEGPIRVRLIVDAQGKVKQATLLNRLGYGLDELAMTRAKQIEFEPAKDTDDRAVTSVVVWTFHMTLPK